MDAKLCKADLKTPPRYRSAAQQLFCRRRCPPACRPLRRTASGRRSSESPESAWCGSYSVLDSGDPVAYMYSDFACEGSFN
ncbi:hypothetical protein FK513_29800, partial [Klebsiella pneumoniae]|nr:hypothetical protein [Klebsiella pneumoniae]